MTFGFRVETYPYGDFALDPIVFGARATEVVYGGKAPALGDCHASIAWIQMPGPLVDVINAWSEPGFEFVTLAFRANANGLLADGSPGRLIISQTGIFRTSYQGATADAFPAEFVEIRPTRN